MVTAVFLGILAMGQVESLNATAKNVTAYGAKGVSGGVENLVFYAFFMGIAYLTVMFYLKSK